MVAKLNNDKGFSILAESQFNYDRAEHSVITPDMCKSVLDFDIIKKPCRTEKGDLIPRMFYLERNDGAIVDANCSVGDEFEVTCQPIELMTITGYLMEKLPHLRVETVATMYNGGTSFITLSFGDKWSVPGDSSAHYTNVVMCNPLSRGMLHLVQSTVRVVCMNTLARAMKTGEGYRIRHTKNARALMEQAFKGMQEELELANNTRLAAEFLASKPIATAQVNALMDEIYPLPVLGENDSTNGLTRMKNKRDEVLAQFEEDKSFTSPSFWSFYNANSFLIEHPLHKQERVDNAQVAFENITGSRAAQKARIFEKVLAVAQAA